MTITDETLRAYVDGELSAEESDRIRQRLETDDLARERASLMQASGDYLAAARTSMADDVTGMNDLAEAILNGTVDAPKPAPAPPAISRRHFFRPAMAASIAAVFFGLGGVAGMNVHLFSSADEAMPAWIVRVADYQTLYSRDTVEGVRMSDAEQTAFVARAATTMGQPIDIPDLSAHGLEFRRAQFLSFNGKPVIQMVYLPDGTGEPVALCLIKTTKADAGPKSNQHRNINLVSWRKGGIAFLLAADAPDAALRTFAATSGA